MADWPAWDRTVLAAEGTPVDYRLIQYSSSFERAGAISSGSCGAGIPGFGVGPAWPGPHDLTIADINADPDLAGWTTMTLMLSPYGGANISWNCPCHVECTFGSLYLSGEVLAGGGPVLDYQGNPCYRGGEDGGAFALPGTQFQFGSHDPSTPMFFTPADPPPGGLIFHIENSGNHIRLSFQLLASVFYEAAPAPPPPAPLPWPSQPAQPPPPCGSFTPN